MINRNVWQISVHLLDRGDSHVCTLMWSPHPTNIGLDTNWPGPNFNFITPAKLLWTSGKILHWSLTWGISPQCHPVASGDSRSYLICVSNGNYTFVSCYTHIFCLVPFMKIYKIAEQWQIKENRPPRHILLLSLKLKLFTFKQKIFRLWLSCCPWILWPNICLPN